MNNQLVLVFSTGFQARFTIKQQLHETAKYPICLREFHTTNSDEVSTRIDEIISFELSREGREYIFQRTMGLSENITWGEVRVERITSSNAHNVLHIDKK